MAKRTIKNATIALTLFVSSLVCLFPFFWQLRSSFMTSLEIFSMPMQWLPEKIRWQNYGEALTAQPFHIYFFNSFFLVIVNVIGNVFSSSFVAFGFSKLRFRGRDIWFSILISTLMIPSSVILIPQFIGWKMVGAYNSFWPLVVPAFCGNAFFVFLVRQFFLGIPSEYDEAAYIDGASYLQFYSRIIMPMSRPVLTTVAVFTFITVWNDFFGPLIYLSDERLWTLALGLRSFIGQYTSDWHLMMAVSTIMILPVIIMYFFAQRYLLAGISVSGIKG